MDKIIMGHRIRLEILPPLPEYAKQLAEVIRHNREHLDLWRGDVLKYETDELSFYKLLMDNYYYERDEGYFYHIMKKDKIIGNISVVSSGQVWEIAYWLDKNHIGKGYMCDAVSTLEKAWFQTRCDALTVLVKPKNTASVNVVRKMGYQPFGINKYLKNYGMFIRQYSVLPHPECIVRGDETHCFDNVKART